MYKRQTEIQLQKMGEPGVPTVEEYCAKVLPEGGKLGLCGLTASCGLVRGLEKALEAKHGRIKTLDLEDELWTEGRPALPATPAWILPKEHAGLSHACLLYTSDAADEEDSVDPGGPRIIKKKNTTKKQTQNKKKK